MDGERIAGYSNSVRNQFSRLLAGNAGREEKLTEKSSPYETLHRFYSV